MTRRLVAPSKDGRSKVVSYADVAFEFIAELFGTAAVGIETRYLVFVLVGHQLEEVFGYRLREFGGTRRGLSLGAANLRNGCEIAVGVGFILIFGEEFGSIGNRFVQCPGCRCGACPELGYAANPRQIVRGKPPPAKSLLVHLDRGAVDLDRPQNGVHRKRNRAFLERKAEHES